MAYQQIVANFINLVGVLLVVELLKIVIPKLREAVPWLIPIIAAVIGPIMAILQGYLGAWLGIAINLDPIVAIFTGASAVVLYQVQHQRNKQLVARTLRSLEKKP